MLFLWSLLRVESLHLLSQGKERGLEVVMEKLDGLLTYAPSSSMPSRPVAVVKPFVPSTTSFATLLKN